MITDGIYYFNDNLILKESKMLVLTRKIDESIIIADEIEIKVTEIAYRKVRLAIDAPKHIPIHRKEIFLAIQAEKEKDESV